MSYSSWQDMPGLRRTLRQTLLPPSYLDTEVYVLDCASSHAEEFVLLERGVETASMKRRVRLKKRTS